MLIQMAHIAAQIRNARVAAASPPAIAHPGLAVMVAIIILMVLSQAAIQMTQMAIAPARTVQQAQAMFTQKTITVTVPM